MSQQGSIFSISPNGSSNGQSPSPFQKASNSPFAVASGSSNQQANSSSPFETAPREDASPAIPQRRPDGQPPAALNNLPKEDTSSSLTPIEDTQHQQPSSLQMSGFSDAIESNRPLSAAPAPTYQQRTALFNENGYHSPSPELEPQQDFASLPSYQQQQQPNREERSASSYPTTPSHQDINIDTPQLVMRAIFSVSHALSSNEIVQRLRTLPSIRNVAVVGANQFHAISNFRQVIQSMGFGSSQEMKLNSAGGDVDFITVENTTLAVLLEGAYAPGVRETLLLAAKEISRLS